MGFSGISAWQLGIVLLIVIMIFGTKRIRQAGGDVGGAIRGVREGFKGDGADLKDVAKEVRSTVNEVNEAAEELTK